MSFCKKDSDAFIVNGNCVIYYIHAMTRAKLKKIQALLHDYEAYGFSPPEEDNAVERKSGVDTSSAMNEIDLILTFPLNATKF